MSLIDRIHARCIEEGDCWLWQGGCAGYGAASPQISVGGKKLYVRRALAALGGPIPEGTRVSTTCQTALCVCPAHLKLMTNAQLSKRAGEQGKYSGIARCAKIAAAKRASVGKLTEDQVRAIRSGETTPAEAAAKYGINKSLAYRIRRGAGHKDYSNPFAGLMA